MMVNVYFDTEFTGLQKDTELISIGLISETGEEYYAEFEGINYNKQEDWIKQNVLSNTVLYGNKKVSDIMDNVSAYYSGTKKDIAKSLKKWLSQFDKICLVSDVYHYDMVLFIDIFGSAWDVPEGVCPTCYDINQGIADYYGIDVASAFNINREKFVTSEIGLDTNIDIKHNALYDATIIKEIYDFLYSDGKFTY